MAQFPGIYTPRYTDSIASLMARQGDIAARGAERSGEIWGQAINQLGQIGAGAVQAHQAGKDQKKRESMFNDALASWDPSNPGAFYRAAAVAYGPELATSAVRALSALEVSKQKAEPDPKLFQPKAEFLGQMWKKNPEWVKKSWGGIAQALGPEAKALYGLDLTPEWDDAYAGFLDSLAPQEKAEPPKVVGKSLVTPEGKVIYQEKAEPKAPQTQNIGGRVMQFNPESGRFDIDLGSSEAALSRAESVKGRDEARAERETLRTEKKVEKQQQAAEAAKATDDQVRAAFGAMKSALGEVKRLSKSKAITSPLESANARQQYDEAAKAFAATLSRATGDTRISDLDRKAYASLLTYQGLGSGAIKIMRPDLVEARLKKAEEFFEAAAKERKTRPVDEDETPTGLKGGTGTSKDPYRFE